MDKSIRKFYEEVVVGDIVADYLLEGINDTAIFKAVFLAGGPGSGKSFIGTEQSPASKTLSPTVGGDPRIFMGGGQLGLINIGMRVVNPDPAYEKLLKAAGLDPKNSADIWSDKGQEIRVRATDITAKQKSLYVTGRLGVIIDGTGSNVSKVQGQKALLDKVGYECAMIYVNTDLQTAIDRDQNRSRTIGADKVSEMWNNVQKNLKKYESIFGKSNMYVIDNSNGADWHSGCKVVHKKLEKWIRRAPTDPKAKGWIESQKMRNMPKGGIRESVDESVLSMMKGLLPKKRRPMAKSVVGGRKFFPKGTEKITPNLYNKIYYDANLELYQQPRSAENPITQKREDEMFNKHAKKNGVVSWAKVEDWADFWQQRMTDEKGHSSLWSEDWMGIILNLGIGPFKDYYGKEKLKKYNTKKGSEFDKAFSESMNAMKESVLPEGFMDTFLGRNMKKGNVDKKIKKSKSENAEQVKVAAEIDRKLKLVDDLMQKVRPLGGNLGGLMSFRRLPMAKMTPKGMYVALNDWYHSVEDELDYGDDSVDLKKKYQRSVEDLYQLWEEVGFKLSDYMWASGYNVKGIGQMAKIGFPAKKRTDPEWLKMNESVLPEGFVELDEVFGTIGLGFIASTLIKVAATTLMGAIIGGEIGASRKKSAGWTARPRRENSILDLISDKATLKTMQKKYPEALEMIGKNKDIINYSKSITNTKDGPDKKQMQTLKKMIKDEFEKSGISWNDFISSVEPLVRKSVKDAKKKMDESVELDENFIAFDYDHEVLTHFQTKADGMRWKNHKNAPDSYYLVKTKHRLLKGDMASEGSDSLSKHLDSQPFPKKDGANFSVHKESVLPEGFMDTFLGRNMKKGNVDKKKSKKSKNPEQVKLSTEIDRKLRLIDDLMQKVRPLGGNLGRLMSFRKLPLEKMTPKGMYVALNDWWSSIEADLDDDSEDDNKKYARSAEKLYDLWEEVGFRLSDYMWASGYNVKGIGQMAKIGFPAKKRTDPEWLKMNESGLPEGFMDTFLGKNMKKGNVAKQNPVRTLGKLGEINQSLVRKILEETRRFEKAMNGELFGTRLQRQETVKFIKSLRNDSTTIKGLKKDFENALYSWNAALDNSIEKELLDPMDEDYWQDKIYLVKDLVKKILSEMHKIDETVLK